MSSSWPFSSEYRPITLFWSYKCVCVWVGECIQGTCMLSRCVCSVVDGYGVFFGIDFIYIWRQLTFHYSFTFLLVFSHQLCRHLLSHDVIEVRDMKQVKSLLLLLLFLVLFLWWWLWWSRRWHIFTTTSTFFSPFPLCCFYTKNTCKNGWMLCAAAYKIVYLLTN